MAVLLLLGQCLSTPAQVSARPLMGLSTPVILQIGAADGAAAWADFDNDDELDLLLTGIGTNVQRTTQLFQNNGGTLTPYDSNLPRLEASSVDWGDYDNDGYLDVLITGQRGFVNGQIRGLAEVYHNIAGANGTRSFVLAATLPHIYSGAGEWGDYNNDGRLDILLTGYSDNAAPLTQIYRNDGGGVFISAVSGLVGLGNSQALWGDYNNDGYLDFVIMGRDASGGLRTLVYRNSWANSFAAPISLTGMWAGAPAWIDVENDGDMDLLLTGNRGDNGSNIRPTTELYRYDNGGFNLVSGTGLPNLWDSSVSVGDYDNDGDSDLLLNGLTASDRPTAIYLNNRNFTFTNANAGLPNGTSLSVAWGDLDNDKTLDVAVTGVPVGDTYTTRLYLNNNPAPPTNTLPAAPTLRYACWDANNRVSLVWNAVGGDHNSNSLTYNLRIGNAPGEIQRVSPQSNLNSGKRRVSQPGNLQKGTSMTIRNLPQSGSYFWAVQAVDPSLAGGPFSAEGHFEPGTRVAIDDAYSISENQTLHFNLLANDNPAYAPLVIQVNPVAQHGTLTAQGNGNFTYTPSPEWNGVESMSYYTLGSTGYCSLGVVTITVAAVDHAPEDILLSNASILEGRPAGSTIGAFTTKDSDIEETVFTYSLVPNGADNLDNGLFQIVNNELRTAAVLSYNPRHTFTINVQVRDPKGLTRTKLFTITVLENTLVSISCVSNCGGFTASPKAASVTMSEDGSPTPFQLTLRANDNGASETLTWSAPLQPAHGSLTYRNTTTSGQDQPVQYAPAADYFGPDTFTLRVTDPLGNTDQVAVTVTVQPINDAPTLDALPDIIRFERTGAQQIALSGIGPGPANEASQPLTITAETSNPNLLRDLTVEYPGSGSSGVLRFRLDEGTGEATVTIMISDGQAENGVLIRTFKVTVVDGPRSYLPIVFVGQ